jgi:pimeloyl-ACP methyl ester carboxylesterase
VRLRLGRQPLLVPLAGTPGTVTSLTTPDSQKGADALNPGNRYPEWRQEVSASSALRVGFYRPGRQAARIKIPFLVLAYEQDGVAPVGPAIKAAKRAPRGELACLPGGHYAAYLAGHEEAVDVLLSFLRRHLLDEAQPSSAAESVALAG